MTLGYSADTVLGCLSLPGKPVGCSAALCRAGEPCRCPATPRVPRVRADRVFPLPSLHGSILRAIVPMQIIHLGSHTKPNCQFVFLFLTLKVICLQIIGNELFLLLPWEATGSPRESLGWPWLPRSSPSTGAWQPRESRGSRASSGRAPHPILDPSPLRSRTRHPANPWPGALHGFDFGIPQIDVGGLQGEASRTSLMLPQALHTAPVKPPCSPAGTCLTSHSSRSLLPLHMVLHSRCDRPSAWAEGSQGRLGPAAKVRESKCCCDRA